MASVRNITGFRQPEVQENLKIRFYVFVYPDMIIFMNVAYFTCTVHSVLPLTDISVLLVCSSPKNDHFKKLNILKLENLRLLSFSSL